MAVKSPDGATVDFGNLPVSLANLTTRTMLAWMRVDALNGGNSHYVFICTGGYWRFYYHEGHFLWFRHEWAVDGGSWYTALTPTLGTWYHVGVSYDRTDASKNPLFYIDGVEYTPIEADTPSGAGIDDSAEGLHVCGLTTALNSDVSMKDARIYNRILSASEILAIKNEDITTAKTINNNGLVFHAPLLCAKGLTYATFPGHTLAAAHELFDRVGCMAGVPTNNPIGE